MKKTLLSCLALALMAVSAPLAKAQDDKSETQPVLAISFSGYGELKRDLEYLGTLSGNPDMAAGLEQLLMLFTQGQGLAGLDQSRPWGVSMSITDDASQFPALAFLPVDDLSKLLDALAAYLGEAVDAGDDIFEIRRNTNTFFIKQKGKWAYLAQQKSDLEDLPANPLKLLRGLDKKYDLAVTVNLQNIPQGLRDSAAELIKQGMEVRLLQTMNDDDDDEDDEQSELRAQLARSRVEEFVKGINQLDQFTVGLNIDRPESRTYLDVEVTAVPGSDAAKQFASASDEPEGTRFSGVLMPEALLSLHINSPVGDDDEERFEALLENVRTTLMAEIDNEEDLDDDQKDTTKELAGKLLDIVEDTVDEEGRLNAGVVVVGEGPLTVAMGCLVADASELEEVVKQFITLAAKDGDLPKPKFNAQKYKGYRFHTLSVPVPDDDNADQLRALLGDPLKLVLAFGEDIFYLAVGDDGIETIKQVIDGSAETPTEKLPQLTISLALAPLMKLAGSQGSLMAGMLAQGLAGGKDHVKITVEPVDNGVRYRIEGEEGVNKLLGQYFGLAARTSGAGGQ